uniref:Uncharacterized protein n=1 Tax=Nicotiana tabacum TaxID=4097 RepID=A0A1S4D4D3_TOBAC|nr:PREDICTED: uncharacterized protein LOC107825800 [Nicotiana tabacum]
MLPAMTASTALQNDQNIPSLLSAMAASPSSSNEHKIPSYCCPLFLLLRSSLLLSSSSDRHLFASAAFLHCLALLPCFLLRPLPNNQTTFRSSSSSLRSSTLL